VALVNGTTQQRYGPGPDKEKPKKKNNPPGYGRNISIKYHL